MDESTLSDIVKLLSGSIGPSTRTAACTALAGCCAGEAGSKLRSIIGTTSIGETAIQRLLVLCGDPKCARMTLSALVNISEDAEASNKMIKAGAVERATKSLLDPEQRPLASLYAGLLSNMTRYRPGAKALVGEGMGSAEKKLAIDRLLQLVTRIEKIPNILWISNASAIPEGRAVLLASRRSKKLDTVINPERQPLTWLLRLLPSPDEANRLAAASALRNFALDEDCHEDLIESTEAIGMSLARLMTRKHPVSPSSVKNASKLITDRVNDPSKIETEPLIEIRKLLVEALLLLCKSMQGRKALWDQDVYPVLENWNREEQSEEIRQAVTSVIDRITIAEDKEDSDNLVKEFKSPNTTV